MKRTYLPAIHGEGVGGTNDKAQEFVAAWLLRLGARAKLMRPDARLQATAQAHALFLAARTGEAVQQSMHIGANNSTPNARVRAAGYRLPGVS